MNKNQGGCVAGPGNSTRKQSQVEDQLAILDKTVYRLAEIADQLEVRLSGVTRQEDSCKAAGCGPLEDSLVPMAEMLRAYRNRVALVADRLDSLFLRIEL